MERKGIGKISDSNKFVDHNAQNPSGNIVGNLCPRGLNCQFREICKKIHLPTNEEIKVIFCCESIYLG